MEENNSKEINLLQLLTIIFNWIGKFFQNIFKLIGKALKLSYRNRIVVIIILVLAIILGQYLSRSSARVYKAEAMAMINGSQAQTVKEVMKQLQASSPTNKSLSFGIKLSLPDSIAKNIVQISSFDVIDYLDDNVADEVDFDNKHSLSDTLNLKMKDRLYFVIKTKNINQVPIVQNAILNFLNTNSVLLNNYNIEKSNMLSTINICEVESKRIDSLARVNYFKQNDQQLNIENNKLLIGEQRKQLFYGELIELQNIKAGVQFRLQGFKAPIILPSNFVVNPIPVNGRVKYGVISILIGFALALFISILIENIKSLITYLKSE